MTLPPLVSTGAGAVAAAFVSWPTVESQLLAFKSTTPPINLPRILRFRVLKHGLQALLSATCFCVHLSPLCCCGCCSAVQLPGPGLVRSQVQLVQAIARLYLYRCRGTQHPAVLLWPHPVGVHFCPLLINEGMPVLART